MEMDIAETVVQCCSPCSTEAPHTPTGTPISVSSYLLNGSTDTYLYDLPDWTKYLIAFIGDSNIPKDITQHGEDRQTGVETSSYTYPSSCARLFRQSIIRNSVHVQRSHHSARTQRQFMRALLQSASCLALLVAEICFSKATQFSGYCLTGYLSKSA